MLTLAFESSATAASAALSRDGELLGQYYQHSGLTHSRTLLPMAEELLRSTGTDISGLDSIAVARGPGSFTGVRIGISVAKGLAWALEIPITGVSTLEAMAYHGVVLGEGALICSAMDARRNEVYNAVFEISDGLPVRLCEDRAVPLSLLAEELEAGKYGRDRQCRIVGDGALLAEGFLANRGVNCSALSPPLRLQSAWGVTQAALRVEAVSPDALIPVYQRVSQAEREAQNVGG